VGGWLRIRMCQGCEGVEPGTSEKTKRDIRGRNQCGLWGGREFNVVGRCGHRGSVRAPPRLGAIPWTQRHTRRREGIAGEGWATPTLCGAINGLSGWVGVPPRWSVCVGHSRVVSPILRRHAASIVAKCDASL